MEIKSQSVNSAGPCAVIPDEYEAKLPETKHLVIFNAPEVSMTEKSTAELLRKEHPSITLAKADGPPLFMAAADTRLKPPVKEELITLRGQVTFTAVFWFAVKLQPSMTNSWELERAQTPRVLLKKLELEILDPTR